MSFHKWLIFSNLALPCFMLLHLLLSTVCPLRNTCPLGVLSGEKTFSPSGSTGGPSFSFA
jgi:hypothetical protein